MNAPIKKDNVKSAKDAGALEAMMPRALDAKKLRADFPILQTEEKGRRLVYLDSAASSQKPQVVIDSISKYYSEQNANIHRGVYRLSQEATGLYERTRQTVSRFIGTPCARSVIFTRGTTEGINLVASTWGRQNVRAGDEIVLTQLEHHSNLVPWQMLARETGAVLKFIPLKEDATLDMERAEEAFSDKTKLMAIGHMSNATGTIHPIKELIQIAQSYGAATLIDGAQGACHLPVNVVDLDCDFYAFSAHKMLGPTGVGVLYGREDILAAMPPYHGGGDMIETVTDTDFTTAELPAKFEAGTPNIAGIVAFRTAIDYITQVGLEAIHNHELDLIAYALPKLEAFGGLKLYGPTDVTKRGGVISFTFDKVHPHDVGQVLADEGVAIRAGHHCAQPFMRRCGISGTNRASFYLYNDKEDIDRLMEALHKVKEIFKHVFK